MMEAGVSPSLGRTATRFCQTSSVMKGMNGCSSRSVRSRTWAKVGRGDGSAPERIRTLAISIYQSQ